MTFEELVKKIGLGFHPDTRGEDYIALPAGVTPELYNEIVQEAEDSSFIYERTIDIFVAEGWIT